MKAWVRFAICYVGDQIAKTNGRRTLAIRWRDATVAVERVALVAERNTALQHCTAAAVTVNSIGL